MLFSIDPASLCWACLKEQGCVNLGCSRVRGRWSPFVPRWVSRRVVHGQSGAISGYVERVNERFGRVNSSDKRRPLALSGERTCWPLVSPWGTGVAKGKSCLGSDPHNFCLHSRLAGPENLVQRCRCKALRSAGALSILRNFKTFFHYPVLFPPSGVQTLLDS